MKNPVLQQISKAVSKKLHESSERMRLSEKAQVLEELKAIAINSVRGIIHSLNFLSVKSNAF